MNFSGSETHYKGAEIPGLAQENGFSRKTVPVCIGGAIFCYLYEMYNDFFCFSAEKVEKVVLYALLTKSPTNSFFPY
jgi:hypothetical protein